MACNDPDIVLADSGTSLLGLSVNGMVSVRREGLRVETHTHQ